MGAHRVRPRRVRPQLRLLPPVLRLHHRVPVVVQAVQVVLEEQVEQVVQAAVDAMAESLVGNR